MDCVSWGRLTGDGSWGRFAEEDVLTATAAAGSVLLEHLVTEQGKRLKEHLRGACDLKAIAEQ